MRQTKAKRWSEAFNGDLPQYPILPSDQTFAGTPGVTLTNFFNTLYGALSGLYGGPCYQIPKIAPGGSIVLDTRGLGLGNPSSNTAVAPATFLISSNVFPKPNEASLSWSARVDFNRNEYTHT